MLGSKIDKINPNFNNNSTGSAKNVMQTAGAVAKLAQTIGAMMG